jgi:signal transduction histidine kinase/CheY-like chemotaxis protein
MDLIQELLTCPLQGPLQVEGVLQHLVKAFRANRAGLIGLHGTTIAVQTGFAADGPTLVTLDWPADNWPDLLADLSHTATGVLARSTAGSNFLFTSSALPGEATCLLWLEGATESCWNVHEQTLMALLGMTLARLLVGPMAPSCWLAWLERVRRQQRLEEAAVVVGQLAHDFNNVLTGILGFTELSLGQLEPGSTPHQFVTEAFQAAQQGTHLVNQLSLFSKRNLSRPQPSSVALVAEEAQERLQPFWGESASLQVAVPQDLPAVAIDAQALHLVLHRLLENAREAGAPKGLVTLSARQTELVAQDCLDLLGNTTAGLFVEISISDTGAGFTAEARQRVLTEPFFSNKPRHRGLGLATVYGTLYAHQGGLRLEHGPAGGTTVRIYLPAACNTEPSTLSIRRSSLPMARGEKLLIVDDDPLTLQLMCTTLERAGYRVHSATDGAEALDSVAQAAEPFRLVLSDVVMPRMTGFDLAQRLLDRDPHVNVLFTSGHIPAGFVPEGFVGRTFDLLPKPFRPEGLLRAVRSALDRDAPAAASATAGETEKSS